MIEGVRVMNENSEIFGKFRIFSWSDPLKCSYNKSQKYIYRLWNFINIPHYLLRYDILWQDKRDQLRSLFGRGKRVKVINIKQSYPPKLHDSKPEEF